MAELQLPPTLTVPFAIGARVHDRTFNVDGEVTGYSLSVDAGGLLAWDGLFVSFEDEEEESYAPEEVGRWLVAAE